jgi:hypothetical protein
MSYSELNPDPARFFIAIGDGCRATGAFDQAIGLLSRCLSWLLALSPRGYAIVLPGLSLPASVDAYPIALSPLSTVMLSLSI